MTDVGTVARRFPLPLVVEFAGEFVSVTPRAPFRIGRHGDLVVDDNRHLHRRFLEVSAEDGMWWLANVGSRLAATVTDDAGGFHARLGPGSGLPLGFGRAHVHFAAGSTRYHLTLHTGCAPGFDPRLRSDADGPGEDTFGGVPLSLSQKLLVVALAEPVLRGGDAGRADIPSSADAAARLGWTLPAFTRKLDTVCGKLERQGVAGLRGGRGRLATNRRLRLVEHAIATQLVTRDDLAMLGPDARSAPAG